MSTMGAAIIGSAIGGSVASVAMAPFNAANNFLGSFWYGYGMILGERMMYQFDWPNIQKRLEAGEKYETVVMDVVKRNQSAVYSTAKMIFNETKDSMLSDFLTAFETHKKISAQVGIDPITGLKVDADVIVNLPTKGGATIGTSNPGGEVIGPPKNPSGTSNPNVGVKNPPVEQPGTVHLPPNKGPQSTENPTLDNQRAQQAEFNRVVEMYMSQIKQIEKAIAGLGPKTGMTPEQKKRLYDQLRLQFAQKWAQYQAYVKAHPRFKYTGTATL